MTEAAAKETVRPAPARPAAGVLRRLPAAPLYFWLAALVIAPNILLFATSFLSSSGGVLVYEFSLANYARALGSDTVRLLILRTILTALAAASLATLVAYPLAYYVSRHLGRYKLLAVMLVVIPLWVSLLIRAFAWRIILGENGVLNSFLVNLGLLDAPSDAFLYTRFAVILALTYMAIPYVFISAYTALERVPNSLLEASYDNGATPFRTLLHVVWPLSKQGVAIGFCLAFLLAVGDYLTPTMVGGLDGTMVGMVVASQFGLAGNWPYGSAMAIVLMMAVSLVLLAVTYFSRGRGILQDVDAGAGAPPRQPDRSLGGLVKSLGAKVLLLLPYVYLYLPLLIIGVFSFNDSEIQAMPLGGFTMRWYVELIGDSGLIEAFQRTLLVAGITVGVALVAGVGFAMLFAYLRIRWAGAIQGLLAMPVAIPGIVLGISMVIACQFVGIEPGIPRVVVGHSTFVMPVMMLIVLSRLKRLDPSYVQASMDLGANYVQTFRYVLFPMIRSAVIGGGLLGFTLSVDEVIVSLFLTGIEPTLPVYVWNQMRFGFTPSVNAIFTAIGLVSLGLVLLAIFFMNRSAAGKNGTPEWLSVR
ncbi:ABC transporter permease subunit [Pelagibius sp. CAU 1746]|uniref:ABC transporter permease subunit n=1 Tax=Pelagibius sp. CAU 1746 TaxID=3140370 RepID=UPI00325AC172